jgi:hypothetical protein
MAGEPALPRLRRKCRRRSGARATPRWSAERRTSRLRGTGTPRKREVASYRRDEFKVVRLPALRRPLISGPELQLTPRIRARAPPKRRHMQRRCGGDKATRRDNPGAENAPRERDGLRVRPRGGLFDIVKNDDGRAVALLGRANARARHSSSAPYARAGGRSGCDPQQNSALGFCPDPDQFSARTTGPRRG